MMATALRDEGNERHCPGSSPRQNSRLDTTATVLPFMELTSATPSAPSALNARPCQHRHTKSAVVSISLLVCTTALLLLRVSLLHLQELAQPSSLHATPTPALDAG